jgi:hydrogenase maturation protease
LIIGYGNELRGDDAAGPVAARRLAEHGFRAMAVHQLTPELAEPMSQASDVIFLDADADLSPGEIRVKVVAAAPASVVFEHHLHPSALVRLSRDVFGNTPQAWLVAMGVQAFDLSEEISEDAQRAVAKAVSAVQALCA